MSDELEKEFYSPFCGDVLFKAEESNGQWILFAQASNESKDQEEERIVMKALTEAKDYFLGHGIISWDHQHKITRDPKFIIGEPIDVAFNDKRQTLVKALLYQKNEIAQNLWKNIESGAKILGSSIGGGVIQKSKDKILRVIWNELAITYKPVNDETLGSIQLIPFSEFAKALMAGSGVNAANYTGGRALSGESLKGDENASRQSIDDVNDYEEARKLFDEVLIGIKSGRVVSMNDVIDVVLGKGYSDPKAVKIINFLQMKMPAFITG